MLRLYTFQISHFAEKARWALDWKGVKYQECRLLPGPHLAVTRRLGKVTSVPILVLPAMARWCRDPAPSSILPMSAGRMTAHVADRGGTGPRAELERWLDDELGAPLRRVFYFHALDAPKPVRPLFTQRGPWWGPLFYRVGYRAVASRMRAFYEINADTAEQDRKRVEAVFARVDQLLEGRPYLVGDRFGRADLTLAALAAPLWGPPEHSTRWPPDEAYPARLQELRAELGGWRARTTCCACTASTAPPMWPPRGRADEHYSSLVGHGVDPVVAAGDAAQLPSSARSSFSSRKMASG